MTIINRKQVGSLVLTLLVVSSVTEGRPALEEFPSLTYDALEEWEQNEHGDQQGAETAGPITGAVMGYTAFNTLRNLWRGMRSSLATSTTDQQTPEGSSSTASYVLKMPMRLAKSVGTGAMDMAKTFATTFQDELQKQYRHLSTEIKERVIPEAANLLGVWTVPPTNPNMWLDGI